MNRLERLKKEAEELRKVFFSHQVSSWKVWEILKDKKNIAVGERLIRRYKEIRSIEELLVLIDKCKEYEDVTKEMDKDGASPVISKEELKQRLLSEKKRGGD